MLQDDINPVEVYLNLNQLPEDSKTKLQTAGFDLNKDLDTHQQAYDNHGMLVLDDTPLTYAARIGDKFLFDHLVCKNAFINKVNDNNETPLQVAVHYGRYAIVALIMACLRGKQDTRELLDAALPDLIKDANEQNSYATGLLNMFWTMHQRFAGKPTDYTKTLEELQRPWQYIQTISPWHCRK